jgi:hypothetical protein
MHKRTLFIATILWTSGFLMYRVVSVACAQSEPKTQDECRQHILDASWLEEKRLDLNKKDSTFHRQGDRWIFGCGLNYLKSKTGDKVLSDFAKAWKDPAVSPERKRDISPLYRYFSALAAEQVAGSDKEIEKIKIPPQKRFPDSETESRLPPELRHAKFSLFKTAIPKLGKRDRVEEFDIIMAKDGRSEPVGFYLRGSAGHPARLAFTLRTDAQGYTDPGSYANLYPEAAPIADFPGPMHSGALMEYGKLIELGMVNGEVTNYIFSGGRRRQGMVIIEPDGTTTIHNVESVRAPAGERWNLSRDIIALDAFLRTAQDKKWSVFEEMLLVASSENGRMVSPAGCEQEGDYRRVLAMDANGPGLLEVNLPGICANTIGWISYKLGFDWSVYLDVNYYDGAAYYRKEGDSLKRTIFGGYAGTGHPPYHRVVLFEGK